MPDIRRDIIQTVIEFGPVTTNQLIQGWGHDPLTVIRALIDERDAGRIRECGLGWTSTVQRAEVLS